MPEISTFAGRVTAAAGKSANFELVVRQSKIGGNGPIMANAMLGCEVDLTYVGTVGAVGLMRSSVTWWHGRDAVSLGHPVAPARSSSAMAS